MASFARVRSIIFLLCMILTPQSLHGMQIQGLQPDEHHHHHMSPNEPVLHQFFTTPADLVHGKKIPMFYPRKEPSKSSPLLSREEANSIPFSSTYLPKILKFFAIPEGSMQAETMKRTIKICEAKPMKGETKFCATSMDSLIDLAREAGFGPNIDIKVATTKIDRSKDLHYTPKLQNYTIVENPQEFLPSKAMACHTLVYPYTVYYCHHLIADHKMYKIHLVGENGWKVETLGMCHMDTSSWNPNHPAFLELNTQPGELAVCHFFLESDLVLLPSTIDI